MKPLLKPENESNINAMAAMMNIEGIINIKIGNNSFSNSKWLVSPRKRNITTVIIAIKKVISRSTVKLLISFPVRYCSLVIRVVAMI
jgi:hypothetical protein